MSDLTAADLARLAALAEVATSPPRRTEYGELWVRASPRPQRDDDAVVVTYRDIAALVATVRELARAIVEHQPSGGYCRFCAGFRYPLDHPETAGGWPREEDAGNGEVGYGRTHEVSCPYMRARALAGE